MNYTIFTLGNPEREQHRATIRRAMFGHNEIFIDCVNGKDPEQLTKAISTYGFKHNDPEWRPGEAGLWYTTINAWNWSAENNADLLAFEDDAIVGKNFWRGLKRLEGIDVDFASLYTPYRNPYQKAPFRFSGCNQEHGNICMFYTASGSKKILSLLRNNGLEWPVDIWLFKQVMAGHLRAWTPFNMSEIIVEHDFDVPTTIHEDDRIKT